MNTYIALGSGKKKWTHLFSFISVSPNQENQPQNDRGVDTFYFFLSSLSAHFLSFSLLS